MYNTFSGHAEVAKFLIEKGANINTKVTLNRTPLHWAAKNGYLSFINYQMSEKKKYFLIFRLLNQISGHEEVAKILIEKGANISAINSYNRTPLHLAAENG